MMNKAKTDQSSSEGSIATDIESKSSEEEEKKEVKLSEIGETLKLLKNKVTYEKSKKLRMDIQKSIQEAQQYY